MGGGLVMSFRIAIFTSIFATSCGIFSKDRGPKDHNDSRAASSAQQKFTDCLIAEAAASRPPLAQLRHDYFTLLGMPASSDTTLDAVSPTTAGYGDLASPDAMTEQDLERILNMALEVVTKYLRGDAASALVCAPAELRECTSRLLQELLGVVLGDANTALARTELLMSQFDDVAASSSMHDGAIAALASTLTIPEILYRTDTLDRNSWALRLAVTQAVTGSRFSELPPDGDPLSLIENSDTRAAARFADFFERWLETNTLTAIHKSGSLAEPYVTFAAGQRQNLRTQVITKVFDEAAALPTLWQMSYALNDSAALDASAREARFGLMTHPAVIAAHSDPNGTNPIKMGLFVRQRLLCLPAIPSPDVMSLPIGEEPLAASTTRAKFEKHTKDTRCAGCHTQIDGFGFAFEGFDQFGRRRLEEFGQSINTEASLHAAGSLTGDYSGSDDLLSAMANSPELKSCFAVHLTSFSLGLSAAFEPRCMAHIQDQSKAQGDSSILEQWRQNVSLLFGNGN